MAMKQNNFYLRWQKAAGAAKSESRSQGLRTLVPGLAVVAVSMLGWGVLTLHTSMLKSQREDILNWCSDNTEPYRAATQDSDVCGAVPLADRLFRRDDRAAEQPTPT